MMIFPVYDILSFDKGVKKQVTLLLQHLDELQHIIIETDIP